MANGFKKPSVVVTIVLTTGAIVLAFGVAREKINTNGLHIAANTKKSSKNKTAIHENKSKTAVLEERLKNWKLEITRGQSEILRAIRSRNAPRPRRYDE